MNLDRAKDIPLKYPVRAEDSLVIEYSNRISTMNILSARLGLKSNGIHLWV